VRERVEKNLKDGTLLEGKNSSFNYTKDYYEQIRSAIRSD
jgi:hypothetical protein